MRQFDTAAHVVYEEMVFDLHAWPESTRHKALHENLGGKVGEFIARFTRGDKDVGPELLDFLVKWLQNHILKQDKQYVDYFAANRIAVA